MDKSKIEQIKQENAAAKIQGMKWLKILLFVLGACAIIYGVVTLISSPNKFMAVLSIVIGVLLVLAGLSVKNKSVSNAAIYTWFLKIRSNRFYCCRSIDDCRRLISEE